MLSGPAQVQFAAWLIRKPLPCLSRDFGSTRIKLVYFIISLRGLFLFVGFCRSKQTKVRLVKVSWSIRNIFQNDLQQILLVNRINTAFLELYTFS